MDHKTWRWGKKSSEKTILATDKVNLTSKENEEVQELLADKEKLEEDLKRLNDKLAFALSDCNAKDEQVKKQTKIVKEAVEGWEKAEAEMLSMKQHLDETVQQLLVYEERVAHLDGSLKECMQQLHFVREEQEQRIQDAVMKTSKEFEQARTVLEQQLSETSKMLSKFGIANSHLNKSVNAKEILIEGLKRKLAQAEAHQNALMIRLESTEKDSASLKYEAQVLQKELDIRNEEREFTRRIADASHKQHLDSVEKIARLESECQRLRLLVKKRLPSPSTLAKMKKEVEMLGQGSLEMRKNKLNSTRLMVESSVDNSPETAIRRITTLTEQLCSVEEENKTLKESLNRKANEVQFSKEILSRTASKLLQLESEIESKGKTTLEQPRSNLALEEISLASMSDIDSDDKVSCAESWASALISELEHFRSEKQKESSLCRNVGPSDIKLMDDFVEMEKLAVVSVDQPSQQPLNSSAVDPSGEVNGSEISSVKRTKQQSQRDQSKSIGKIIELIEGISMRAEDIGNSDPLRKRDGNIYAYKNEGLPTGYMARIFQWKTSELNNVLQKFLRVCYDLLNGKADHENFATEITTALDWVINHCFSLQDVSSMRDAIKKQFDWDETPSENEAEIEMFADADKLHLPREQLSCLPAIINSGCHEPLSEEVQYDEKEELKINKDKVISCESEKKSLEWRLQSAMNQLQESEKTIASLRLELQTLKDSKGILEDQIQNHSLMNKEIDYQLTETELKEAHHKILELEVELENKKHYCEELESRYIELQLQLGSMTRDCSYSDINQTDKLLQTDWEITAASEKLAECQETILNLGKQLKALAAPKDASLFDNAVAAQCHAITNSALAPPKDASLFDNAVATQCQAITSSTTFPKKAMKVKNRLSLLDQMLAEDDNKAMVCKPSNRSSSATSTPGFIQPLELEKVLVLNGLKDQDDSAPVKSLAVVPAKKSRARSLWQRLLLERKKKAKKKIHVPLNT